jgi:hypothetical protein
VPRSALALLVGASAVSVRQCGSPVLRRRDRKPVPEPVTEARHRQTITAGRGRPLVDPNSPELAWSSGIACHDMFVKVLDVVAKHERVHVLSSDDCSERSSRPGHPISGGLSFSSSQISYSECVSARFDHHVAEVRVRTIVRCRAVAHEQQVILMNRTTRC